MSRESVKQRLTALLNVTAGHSLKCKMHVWTNQRRSWSLEKTSNKQTADCSLTIPLDPVLGQGIKL